MSGGLMRRGDDPLRLSSSAERMPADVRRQRDRELAVEAARGQVTTFRIETVHTVSHVAMWAAANISRQAEAAAAIVPEERQRVDAVADVATMTIQQLMMQLGR